MFRVAIQIKELISSNVTHAIDNASNPAKTLHKLQREIEEAIITLEGERTLTGRRKMRLQTQLNQNELREADWGDKAKIAMDHSREDLARQALLAREDCREAIEGLRADISAADTDLEGIETAITELKKKREETIERARDQRAAYDHDLSCTQAEVASKADRQLDRIAQLEKRTDFAIAGMSEKSGHASVDREIEEMRRASAIEAEIAAMKPTNAKTPAKAKRKKAK